MKVLVKAYRDRLTKLDVELDVADCLEVIHDVIDEAAPVARAGRHVQQVLSELRKALPDDLDILSIRDLAVEVDRAGDLLIQDAKSTLDFMIAKSSAAQAVEAGKSAKEAQKLNRLAALFFPLMTIAAVFGMNPPKDIANSPSIWIVCGVGLMLGFAVRDSLKRSE